MRSTLLINLPQPAPIPTRYLSQAQLETLTPYQKALNALRAQHARINACVDRAALERAILDAVEKGIQFDHGEDITFGVALFRELFNFRLENELKTLYMRPKHQRRSVLDRMFDTALDDACDITQALFRRTWLWGLFHSDRRPLDTYRDTIMKLYRRWDSISTVYTHLE